MRKARPEQLPDGLAPSPWPGWITIAAADTVEQAAFRSGAALAYLHLMAGQAAVPQALWRARLALRAARLQAMVPKLRAKGAGRAVELFLTRDALAPGALVGVLSDRAARRWCDRLVELGAVRELTGRDAYRLYGV